MTDEAVYEERRRALIDGQDAPGGWTRERLASWGVPWPPPVGWVRQIVMHGFPYKQPTDASSE